MKKKILLLFAVFCLAVSIAGCSSSKDDYCDKDFLSAMSKGLNDRWKDTSGDDVVPGTDEQKEAFSKIVSNELNNIKDYKDKKFEDSKLQELAIKYINILQDQKDALDYVTVNYEKYEDLWDTAYDERSKLIVEINKKYNLDIDKENEDILKEMETNSKEVKDKENIENSISDMIKNEEIKLLSSEYGYKDYEVILENKTSVKFSSFELDVKLKDNDGIIVDTLVDFEDNWEPGTKVKFTFNTDQDFKSYEFVTSYYTE